MSLTQADVMTLIKKRCGPLMTAAGMDPTTPGDYNGPEGRGIRALGYPTASPAVTTDADVAQIPDARVDEFLDHVYLYMLEAILGNLDDVDITAGPRSERLSQLAAQVASMIERQLKMMALMYGYGLGTLQAGYITVDIAEHD